MPSSPSPFSQTWEKGSRNRRSKSLSQSWERDLGRGRKFRETTSRAQPLLSALGEGEPEPPLKVPLLELGEGFRERASYKRKRKTFS
jgi:hypothetical protein